MSSHLGLERGSTLCDTHKPLLKLPMNLRCAVQTYTGSTLLMTIDTLILPLYMHISSTLDEKYRKMQLSNINALTNCVSLS